MSQNLPAKVSLSIRNRDRNTVFMKQDPVSAPCLMTVKYHYVCLTFHTKQFDIKHIVCVLFDMNGSE